MKSFYIGVKGIILQDNKILLLKRIKHNTYYWDAPGGRMDEGEEIADTLKRELQEEIGVGEISLGRLLNIYKLPRLVERDHSLLLIFYKVTGNIQDVFISSEHEDFIWVHKDEFEEFFHKEEGHINLGTQQAIQNVFS